ncbi:hypothetical protein CXF68_07400 [Tenacibaculum sp. Bg11-29]|uniref:hypothetical protein n=1 Tax=Tenacibaculum sp. Bg11-29 TaxID=2058306 RepID=UPI000C338088|nr:hypothetical protein [Tenacibaculum sp. Bg11-29]PKH50531.1 hypothetical protein CXF68_07400 [Tenacibaculum sp. Bg11-29]
MISFKKFENKKTDLSKITGGLPNYEVTSGVDNETGEDTSDLVGRCFGSNPNNGTYVDASYRRR